MRLVVSSADEGAGIGVTRATGFGSGSARSNIWPRIMARFVDGSGAAGAQMATWARLSRQRPKGGRTIRLPTTWDADPAEGRPAGAPAGRTQSILESRRATTSSPRRTSWRRNPNSPDDP